MREILPKIAVKGTENRYLAICDVLDSLNVEYRIQEKVFSYQVPIYDDEKKDAKDLKDTFSLNEKEEILDDKDFDSLSSDSLDGFPLSSMEFTDEDESLLPDVQSQKEEVERVIKVDPGIDDILEKEMVVAMAENFDVELVHEINIIDYEVIAEAMEMWGMSLGSFEEFKKKYCKKKNHKKRKYYGSWHYHRPKITGYETHNESVKNIIVSLKEYCDNPSANKKIVLCAHYDAVPGSAGANDNGSGVAILLAFIINVISAGHTDKWFEILFEDKEETGGIGAKNYIEEFGEDIGEVINLDTCGVGSNIIITDRSNHLNGTSILVDDETIRDHEVLVYPYLPYCDSNIFSAAKYDVLTICTLPTDEAKDKGIGVEFGMDSFSGMSFSTTRSSNKIKKDTPKGIREVFKYMHNGSRDSIEWINYNTMDKILNYISLLI